MKILFGLFFTAAIACGPQGRLFAQDSASVVILSPRVGSEIDAEEREYFGLFHQFKAFHHAVIVRTREKKYAVIIASTLNNGGVQMSIHECSKEYLLRLAELINHFEEFKSGRYKFGTDSAELEISPSERIALPRTESTDARRPSDLLPFATGRGEAMPDAFPDWGFGIGLTTYSPDFSSIDAAFSAAEEKYRQEGYLIRTHSPVHVSLIRWFHLKLRFSPALTLLAEVGRSIGEDDEWKGISLLLLYRHRLPGVPWIQPFVGGGIGSCHLKVERKYGNRIGPISQSGGYRTLESIFGGKSARILTVQSGIEIPLQMISDLTINVGYLHSLSASMGLPEGGAAQVKMGGFLAGARLSIFF